VRVLLDENLPHDLIVELGDHQVVTVQGLGWAGVKNGELLRRAAGSVDALLTMDRKLEFEQDLAAVPFGVVVIRARSNRVQDLRPLIGAINDMQGSYRFYRRLDVVVSVMNLTNEVFGFYTGSPIYPNQREFYRPTVIVGVRWTS
jgi:hypothetical protein